MKLKTNAKGDRVCLTKAITTSCKKFLSKNKLRDTRKAINDSVKLTSFLSPGIFFLKYFKFHSRYSANTFSSAMFFPEVYF